MVRTEHLCIINYTVLQIIVKHIA